MPNSTCRICGDDIEYLEPPHAGGWWAHRHHPADEHDAEPQVRADPYGHTCPSCGAAALDIVAVSIDDMYDVGTADDASFGYWFCRRCGHQWHRFDNPRIVEAVEEYWARRLANGTQPEQLDGTGP